MREYYARFFREVWRQMFIFWKAQIGVSVAAGVISAITNAVKDQTPLEVAGWSIAVAVIGYFAVLGAFFVLAAMQAPVNLDSHRLREIIIRDESIKQQATTVERLRADLLAKHPHDERIEGQVRDIISSLSDRQRSFVQWLLDAGEADNRRVHSQGYSGEAPAVAQASHLVDHEIVWSSNHLVQVDHIYRINPTMIAALKMVLYPPPHRPVTPPQG